MAEQNKIKLTSLLEACLDFTRDPSPANELKVAEIANLFAYREYIPLIEKQIQVAAIIGGIPGDEYDALVCENWLVMGKVIHGILPYVVNLENDLDKGAMTPAVVDLLYNMNIVDSILEHCEKDYKRLEKMVDDTMNFTNLFRLVQSVELLDPSKLDEFMKELREMKQELTPEMLANLKSLAVSASPEFAALKEAVADEAIGKAMEGDFNFATKPVEDKQEPKEEQKPEAEEKAEA